VHSIPNSFDSMGFVFDKNSFKLILSRLLHKLLIINKYYLSIQNFKSLIIKNLKPLMLNVGLKVRIWLKLHQKTP